jgi:ABC-2 type transport system permease protein
MNGVLIAKEIRESRWKLMMGMAVFSLLAGVIPLMYGLIIDMISYIPPGFSGLMGVDLLDNYSLYLWSQWHAKSLYQLGTLLAVLLGMSAVAGEVNSHTISFLLTRPVSRKAVYINKIAAGIIIMAVVVIVSTGIMILISIFSSDQVIEVGRLAVATLIAFIGLVLIYVFSVFFSTLINEPVRAGGITVLLLLGVSVMGWFPLTRKFSLFTHISGGEYIIRGSLPFIPLGLMLAFTAVFLLAGMVAIEKKQL